MKFLGLNKAYVILDEISINQPKTYQKIVFILDSNMSQNTLSKSYISAQESYRYLNLGSSYGHLSSKLVKNGQHLVKCTCKCYGAVND